MKNVDSIVYRNMMRLLAENGYSESQVTSVLGLNPHFFSNYRNGKTKHFRICDLAVIAEYFEVSLDYLCEFKNTRDDFFIHKNKILRKNEKILMTGIKKLDAESKLVVTDTIASELKKSKARIRQQKK